MTRMQKLKSARASRMPTSRVPSTRSLRDLEEGSTDAAESAQTSSQDEEGEVQTAYQHHNVSGIAQSSDEHHFVEDNFEEPTQEYISHQSTRMTQDPDEQYNSHQSKRMSQDPDGKYSSHQSKRMSQDPDEQYNKHQSTRMTQDPDEHNISHQSTRMTQDPDEHENKARRK